MPSASSTSVLSAIGSAVSPFRGGRAPVAARNAPLARPPAASAAVPLLLVQPRQDHPQRRRFTVKLRWRQFGASSAMDVNFTTALDGSDLRLLCPATSGVMWQTTDQLFLSSKREWDLHAATGPRSIRLGRIGVGAIDLNVHLRQLPPAPHPDPPAYVYDIRGEGRVHVRLLAPATGKATQIGTVKAHGSPTVPFRCDPYPVTSADGCRVFVTSLQDGRRQLYCFERTGCPVAHRGAGRAAGSPAPQASGCGHGDRAACAPEPTARPRGPSHGPRHARAPDRPPSPGRSCSAPAPATSGWGSIHGRRQPSYASPPPNRHACRARRWGSDRTAGHSRPARGHYSRRGAVPGDEPHEPMEVGAAPRRDVVAANAALVRHARGHACRTLERALDQRACASYLCATGMGTVSVGWAVGSTCHHSRAARTTVGSASNASMRLWHRRDRKGRRVR